MAGQLRAVNAVAFLLLLLSILVTSKTDAAQPLRARRLKLATSLREMEEDSSSLQTMKQSGPSPSGPGHKSSEALSQGCPQGSGLRPEEGLLHFSRIHH
ncbi:hypothetical protein CRYUN_Cryun06bG0054800 [Craigia yunnanensis]